MKALILVSFLAVISLFYSCQNADLKPEVKTADLIVKSGNVMISADSSAFQSISTLSYMLEANFQNGYFASYKRYFENEDLSKSLDEWINFDSLNRITSIHTAIVKFTSLEEGHQLMIEGKLLSSTVFDDSF